MQAKKVNLETEKLGSQKLVTEHVKPDSNDFRPWVLVARKRKPCKNMNEENNSLSQFENPSQGPSQPSSVSSPSLGHFSAGLVSNKSKQIGRNVPSDSARCADRTKESLGPDKSTSKAKNPRARSSSSDQQSMKNLMEHASLKSPR